MRVVKYSRTWVRISIPVVIIRQIVSSWILQYLALPILGNCSVYSPTINVSGNSGASPTSSPPYPHPMSTTSTSLTRFLAPARFVLFGSGFTKAGKCVAQFMCAGLMGLFASRYLVSYFSGLYIAQLTSISV